MRELVISVSDTVNIDEVAAALTDNGIVSLAVLHELGTITGSSPDHSDDVLTRIKAIRGVLTAEWGRDVHTA